MTGDAHDETTRADEPSDETTRTDEPSDETTRTDETTRNNDGPGDETTRSGDNPAGSTRGPAADAELALLLEVTGTPKPGNVDRHRDAAGLRFEQFAAGAVGARVGLGQAASGDPVGTAFETAVAGMSRQTGGNTQFGCLLLLVPLVAATPGPSDAVCIERPPTDRHQPVLTRERVQSVCGATTVADAVGFYRAFEYVDVTVEDPPEELSALDVRRGSDAADVLRDREMTLANVMDASAPHDANAREWTNGFPRTFAAAEQIVADDGPIPDRIARAFLDLLADEPDTLIRTQHGETVADEVQTRAAEIDSLAAAESWADTLVERGINPGTTADITAAAAYVALRRGVQP